MHNYFLSEHNYSQYVIYKLYIWINFYLFIFELCINNLWKFK
jgi:hypothetical protein